MSIESRPFGSGSFEFEEVWVSSQKPGAIPNLGGFVPSRDASEHRTEKRHAVDVDHRSADLVANQVHSRVMRLAQLLVVLGRLGGISQRRRQPYLAQRIRYRLTVELQALDVSAGAKCGVEIAQHFRAALLLGRDRNPNRSPHAIHPSAIVLTQIAILVQDG